MKDDVRITLRNVSVDFPLFGMSNGEIAEESQRDPRFRRVGRRAVFRALDQINLNVNSGERLGVWGKNGSGKTTLLRTLRGVFPPVSGQLETRGRIQSFLNMAFGLNEDASGWENILLRGVLMGGRPDEMRELSAQIAEFSELGDFLALPLRRYSAGMRMRLAFSIAMSLPSDIVLMDEWLSVGDAEFRAKAARRLQETIAATKLMVVASHNVNLLKSVCTRVIELDQGRIVSDQRVVEGELERSLTGS